MNNKIDEYISIHKELNEIKKKQTKLKKIVKDLESDIKEYMQNNNTSVVKSTSGYEIILYDKKIPQTFKKENVINKLSEKLQNVKMNVSVDELADSIFKNDVFVVEEKIKPNLKNK